MIDDDVTLHFESPDWSAEGEITTLDGNAAAGVLATIFGREMTVAVATCGACGASADVGCLVAYVRAPGLVLRCRACASVLLCVVHGRGQYWVDVGGIRSLRFDD